MIIKRYFISEAYKWKSFNDFKKFSNDILYNPTNYSLYKKRWIRLITFFILLLLHLTWTITTVVLLQTNESLRNNHNFLYGMACSIGVSSCIPLCFWYGFGIMIDDVVIPNESAPLQWNVIPYHYYKHIRWMPKIRKWCPIGLFRISLVQILALLNKIDQDDAKYLFNFSTKTNQFTAKLYDNKELLELENICRRNGLRYSHLNIILGLLYTLKYIDFKSTFIVDKKRKNFTPEKRNSSFWWISSIKPTLMGCLWVPTAIILLLIGALL